MAEHKVLSQAHCPCKSFSGEEMSPLDLVAVAVLAVKAAPGVWLAYRLCSRVLSTHVLLGEGALALLEAQMSVIQKLKALKRCQARAASVKGCYYSLLVNKQSALRKQYHWPEQVLTQTAQVCCCSLGLAKMASAMQPALLLQVCSWEPF